jgi:hypothetical protein
MAIELIRLTHKMTIQLRLVAENCIICSSPSRPPVRKFLDTTAYKYQSTQAYFQNYAFFPQNLSPSPKVCR